MLDRGLPVRLPQEIRTDRLVLTSVRRADAAEQYSAVAESLSELRLWMDWAQRPPSIAQSVVDLAENAERFSAGREFNWSVRHFSTFAFIGRIGLFVLDSAVPKGEIGYWVSTPHTGNGYASEAAAAVLDTALDSGFRRVELRCDSRNSRSARVARTIGMTLDATLINDRVDLEDRSKVRDTLLFCAIR